MNARNGPVVTGIHYTPIGSHVIVCSPYKDTLEGPNALLDVSGEDVTFLLPSRPTKLRSTVVKPYLTAPSAQEDTPALSDNPSTEAPAKITTVHATHVHNG